MPPDTAPHHLIVAGDVLIDRHLYTGERTTPTTRDRRGVCETNELGGAHLLYRLIDRLFALDAQCHPDKCQPSWKAELAVAPPPLNGPPTGHDGYAVWQPYPMRRDSPGDAPKVWRASQLLGYGHNVKGLRAPEARAVPDPDLLVFDDPGFLFRDATDHESWALAERGKGFVLLKMSEPLVQGALWHKLADCCPDRLVCLVGATDLRREKLALGRGLSWEATLDDLRLALHNHPTAHRLLECRHLVVTFSADAALWLDLTDRAAPLARLCLDPTRAEGEWETQFAGEAFGFHCAMAAALARGLAAHTEAPRTGSAALDLMPAIEAGLLAMRDLKQNGHGPVSDTLPAGYPVDRIAAKIRDARDGRLDKRELLSRIDIAWPANPAAADPAWSIVEASQRGSGGQNRQPLLDLAWDVAQRGTAALDGLPRARFGKLLTADRTEIETLRHIRQRMRVYRDDPNPKRPLCIGVFGPPGAGKSFGVKQLTEEVFGEKSWREFNLSQFQDSPDLNGAFHQVRDLALAGLTPVVLWDEFDSRELNWLQYLLAPMQDGRFQDGQLNHAIGKSVFVFAGGTSWSFGEFTPPAEGLEKFRLSKGPDFVSRLDAHMDVLGPNPRATVSASGERTVDPDDITYPLRRALLIRAYLGCKAAEVADFDPHLLHALLRVDQYRHGARSLEKLMELLRGAEPLVVRRSNLPRPAQLGMHVDVTEFTRLMQGEEVAAAIHETWRALARKEGWSMQPNFDKPYAELAEVDKEDNRAAGRRIPEVLALAGLGLRRAGDGAEVAVPEAELRELLEQNIERLAEAEHNGWMNHRERNGWRWAEKRCDAKLEHPAMKPYDKLEEEQKGKDRNSIRHYPDFATRANHRIVRIK